MASGFDLRDAVAVVTGGGGGIGAALADALSARGCHLALADVHEAGLAEAAARARTRGVTVSTHQVDVGDREAVRALPAAVTSAHGRVGVVVNNAGVAMAGTFEQASEADFDRVLDVNLHGVIRMTRAFLPLLRREAAAQLVNVSSAFGLIAPPQQTAYAASKFGVRGFTESLRHELRGSAVGVTVVHPGGVKTGIAKSALGRRPEGPELERETSRWERALRLTPQAAAERIAVAIERRSPRLLIGSDVKRAALVQRLFPETYWRIIERSVR